MKNRLQLVFLILCIGLTLSLRSQEYRIFGNGRFNGGTVFSTDINGNDLELVESFLPESGSNPYLSSLTEVNGELWGTTYSGGQYNFGTIFKITENGHEVMYDFEGHDGANPVASLILIENTLWGITYNGGYGDGVIYKIDTDGKNFFTAHYFERSIGEHPQTNIIHKDDLLIGTTRFGGPNDSGGTLFSFNTKNWEHTVLHTFGFFLDEGAYPSGNLILEDQTIWGTTDQGSEHYDGAIYSFNLEFNEITTHHSFDEGYSPNISKNGNILTGVLEGGGRLGQGLLFTYDVNTSLYNKVFDFDSSNGANPTGELTKRGDKLVGITRRGGENLAGTIFEVNIDGSGYRKIHDFTFNSGSAPSGNLLVKDDLLYGLTRNGGRDNFGIIYSINSTNNLNVIHDFRQNETFGNTPSGTFLQIGRNLFGMNCYGGEFGYGTIFSFELDGSSFKTLHSFDQTTGKFPFGSELVFSNGKIYGTTGGGGIYNKGVIFHINPDGTDYTKIHDFDDQNGSDPRGNILVIEDKLYGSTASGGSNNIGTVYSINIDGSNFKTLVDFNIENGALPFANGLIFFDNKIWGSTRDGGENNHGVIFNMDSDGSNFNIVFQFDLYSSGQRPRGNFVVHDSKLYGMFTSGPLEENLYNNGGIFSIDKSGNFDHLHIFNPEYDPIVGSVPAKSPFGGLTLHKGALYGTTYSGGFNEQGTIFRINPDGTEYSKITDLERKLGGNPQYGKLLIADITYVPLKIVDEVEELNIYPTLVFNNFKITPTLNQEIKRVNVIGLDGKTVKSFTFGRSDSYDISEISSGNYIIKLELENGKVAKGRIIKR